MNILVIEDDSFEYLDVESIFLDMGYKVFKYKNNDIHKHMDDQLYKEIEKLLDEHNISIVFSFNYYPIISYVLEKTEIKYISYVYDFPQISLYTCSVVFSCNYIFISDYAVYEELSSGGINTVYYLPISINIKKVNEVVENITNNINYNSLENIDVSYIGDKYKKEYNLYDKLYERLYEEYDYVRGYIDSLVQAQSGIYGYFFLDKMLTDDVLKILNYVYPYEKDKDSIVGLDWIYSNLFLAEKVTEIDRINILKKLSDSYELSVFECDKYLDCLKINKYKLMDYNKEVLVIYNKSKINLNISKKSLLTGIPLKCIEIMGSGGFLLTNYQADLFRHFEAGVHFDYYTDEEDLMNKIEYYMEHEDERMMIAENARKIVAENHNLENYIKEILAFVEEGI